MITTQSPQDELQACGCAETCLEYSCNPTFDPSENQLLTKVGSASHYGLQAFKRDLLNLEFNSEASELTYIYDFILVLSKEQDRQGVIHG